jgi:sodium-dependent dicarboxylate transporter 2/3/5
MPEPSQSSRFPLDLCGLILGPTILISWLTLTTPEQFGLAPEAHRLAGVMMLTILWWLTEPIPIPGTAILAVCMSVFLGAVPIEAGKKPAEIALGPFADPSAYFLVGGMFIGQAMQRHGLDRRFALAILCTRWAGRSPGALLAGVGMAVMLVSMWTSNTAATAMVYPVTMGIISVLSQGTGSTGSFAHSRFATGLLLITAYASSVGGVATPIGSGTNVLARGLFARTENLGTEIAFLNWMLIGIPVMIVGYIGMTVWLRRLSPSTELDMPTLRDYLLEQQRQLGPWRQGEINTLVTFIITVTLWIMPAVLTFAATKAGQDWYRAHFSEDIVALFAPVLMFLLPVDWRKREFTIDVRDLQKVDWGAILLFGAGLSLGQMMAKTGLASVVGTASVSMLGTTDLWTITAVAITAGIVLSEFTSNAAAVATLFPVILAIARAEQLDPWPPLLGLTFAASFGSALPVSTPPNAIVYGSGLIRMPRMIVAGLGLDIVCGIAIWVVLRVAFGLGWTPT